LEDTGPSTWQLNHEREDNQMKTSMRGDNHIHPQEVEYRFLTNEECRKLGDGWNNHVHILDRHGKIAQVKVTSVKTWKTRDDIEVNCKFGLYEYFTVRMSNDSPNTELVALL
jgi:hypothetical protein